MRKPIFLTNFNLHELVSPQVLELLGANAWVLFNEDFLCDVDHFVTDLKKDLGCKSVIVNDWKWGGGFIQSGFREHNSTVGSPRSQHKEGNALDLKFVGITIDQALAYLVDNQSKYPHIKRYENLQYTRSDNMYGGWLHLDGKLDEPILRGFNP